MTFRDMPEQQRAPVCSETPNGLNSSASTGFGLLQDGHNLFYVESLLLHGKISLLWRPRFCRIPGNGINAVYGRGSGDLKGIRHAISVRGRARGAVSCSQLSTNPGHPRSLAGTTVGPSLANAPNLFLVLYTRQSLTIYSRIMGTSHPSPFAAHRCSFHEDRQDPYLRLGAFSVFVRDPDRSRQFYLDQLGFRPAYDTPLASQDHSLAVAPPDGTAVLLLVAPPPESEEFQLIGRSTRIVFLTEDVLAKFEEWSKRGVHFHHPPEVSPWGAISTSFEDVDGNSFTLLSCDEVTREVHEQRRAHVERFESEHRSSQELELARQVQARLFPQKRPALSTLEYAAVCIQARQVGGDFYDFLELGRNQLGLVIGDVVGKE